ncbi:DMT family transporter [Nocardioides montaniterrae]
MEHAEPSRLLRLITVPLMLLAGGMVAIQSQINGRLAHELGTGPRAGIGAACISFATGLVVLLVAVLGRARHRAKLTELAAAVRAGRVRWFEVIAGLFGAFLVSTQGLTVATIGVALFSVAITAGQSCSALVVDRLGIGPGGAQPLNLPRVVAAAFAVVAVVVASGSKLAHDFSWHIALFTLLPFLAGAGTSVQAALNGRIARVADPLVTTLNNFAVGMCGLLVAFALSFLGSGSLDGLPGTWWLYLGGVIGMTFIWLSALLVHVHGVLVLGLSMIAGQVIGAQVIEAVIDGTSPGTAQLVACTLTVLGVLIALLLRTRRIA